MVSKTKIIIVIGAIAIVALIIVAVALGIHFGIKCDLKGRIMKKCTTYENDIMSQKDCDQIWDSFKQAFVGKDPCEVPPEAYDSLKHTVSQVSKEPACNRRMFWSRTDKEAHTFANKCSYLTLEDTLPGFLLDGVEYEWCSKKESQEICIRTCPSGPNCDDPKKSFWKRFSAAFAASACGDVSVMLDGTIDMSYDPKSTFASVEVPHFTPKMRKLTVLLVTEEKDKCETDKSLNNLQNDLASNLIYQCRVVPKSQLQNCM